MTNRLEKTKYQYHIYESTEDDDKKTDKKICQGGWLDGGQILV